MKQQLQDFLTKLAPVLGTIRHYLVFGVMLSFMMVYVLLVLRINGLAGRDPTNEQVQGKLQTIQRPKVDKETLAKIQQLQDENIQVKTLFDQARQSPFSE